VRGVQGMANGVEARLPQINKRPDPQIVREIIAELKAEVAYAAEVISRLYCQNDLGRRHRSSARCNVT
jgi:hypothetical protein